MDFSLFGYIILDYLLKRRGKRQSSENECSEEVDKHLREEQSGFIEKDAEQLDIYSSLETSLSKRWNGIQTFLHKTIMLHWLRENI